MAATEPAAIETPTRDGPPADPALLAQGGASTDAGIVGLSMALETMQRYGKELEEDGQKVKNALSSLSAESVFTAKSTSEAAEVPQQLLYTLTDMTNVNLPTLKLTESFITASVLLATFSVASIVGSYLFDSFISLFVPHIGAALISAFILPIATAMYLRGQTQLDGIITLVGVSAIQGLLSGSAFSSRYVTAEPFLALTAIAAPFAISAIRSSDRHTVLGLVAASSMGIHSLIALVEGGFTGTYVLLAMLYTLAVIVPIQLSAVDQSNVNSNLYATISFGITVAAKTLVYAMAGYETSAQAGHGGHSSATLI